jgi:hypothetical protein
MICPFCGTPYFVCVSDNHPVHPSVRGKINKNVELLVFTCVQRHVFMTVRKGSVSASAQAAESWVEVWRSGSGNVQ